MDLTVLINYMAAGAGASPVFDWSPFLIAGIPGMLALGAVVAGKYFDARNARRAAQNASGDRKEPTWPELVTENRDLRTELSSLSDAFDEYREEQRKAKKEQDGKIEELVVNHRLADRREALLYEYTKAMRNHIINELPPPPPAPHPELVEWFESYRHSQEIPSRSA